MLSSTYTITDIKADLVQEYDYYGYTSDASWTAELSRLLNYIYLNYFLERVGETSYSTIAAKDKTDLTDYETYLYWAEVYITCYHFLKEKRAQSSQLQSQINESLKVEGYQYTANSGFASVSEGSKSEHHYFSKAFTMFKRAGFNIMSLERTCTIFGDGTTGGIDNVIE